jgi:hypothetical protein
MKLTYTTHKVETVETNLDLPIFIYLQGELMDEECIKWDGKTKTSILRDWNGVSISSSNIPPRIYPTTLENDLISKEEFEEQFEYALNQIKPIKAVSDGLFERMEIMYPETKDYENFGKKEIKTEK